MIDESDFADLKLNSDFDNVEKSILKFQKSILIENNQTDLICLEYSNRIFIGISSTGKAGVVLSLKSEQIGSDIIYTVKNLLGQEETELNVFARSLVEKLRIKRSVTKPILLTVGIEKTNLKNLNLFRVYEKAILDFYNSTANSLSINNALIN